MVLPVYTPAWPGIINNFTWKLLISLHFVGKSTKTMFSSETFWASLKTVWNMWVNQLAWWMRGLVCCLQCFLLIISSTTSSLFTARPLQTSRRHTAQISINLIITAVFWAVMTQCTASMLSLKYRLTSSFSSKLKWKLALFIPDQFKVKTKN